MLAPPTGVTLTNYLNALHSDALTHARMTFLGKGIVLTDQHFEMNGISINSVLNGDIDLTMGRAVMSTVEVAILKGDHLNGVHWDDEVKIEIGVEIGNSTYWTTLGYFTGTKRFAMATVSVVDFAANDRMQKFECLCNEWRNALTFPMTLEEMYQSLCTYVGVPYESGDELPNIMSRSFSSDPLPAGDFTCRDVLGYIAEACGCYAKITTEGNCKLIWFADHDDEITIKEDNEFNLQYFDLLEGKTWAELESFTWEDLEDYAWANIGGYEAMFKVDAFRAIQTESNEETDYPGSGLNGNIYTIVDNPFLVASTAQDQAAYLQPIYDRLNQFRGYLPLTVECVGNPLVEAGDVVTVQVEGKQISTPIFVKTLHWNGAITDLYEVTGNLQRETISVENSEKLSQGTKYTTQNDIRIVNNQIEIKPGGKLVYGDFQIPFVKTTGTLAYRENTNGVSACSLYKIGNIVCFSGRIHTMTANNTTNGTYFTLPSGFRPNEKTTVSGFINVNSTMIPAIFEILTTGEVQLVYSNYQTCTQVFVSGTFPIMI